ncbi:hypothetical protein CcCBS67573_g01477 [Chytriomyces confervae]|uniref:Ribosomal RNA-processing protein 42 n=1 Tax=Chytriomyces confervae TaxID=246404 RepID=A0A507FPH5_9FUNG|nr:Exosome complex component RRP42 [Chytriomyces hyalinus]TPX77236.1 hypothetical protein CcCBS67573_g01477 [Chytriomyces confervae]
MAVSVCEREFTLTGVASNIRSDGRGRSDVRAAAVESGGISQASGSCRVSSAGGTTVLVGIKVAVGAPAVTASTAADADLDADIAVDNSEDAELSISDADLRRGRVVCAIDCNPAIIPTMDPRAVEDLCIDFSEVITKILNADHGGLDLQSLCIVPGSTCWVIHVDALVLGYGGNLLDTLFQATRGALHDTLIPKVTVEESTSASTGNTSYEFDVADDETEDLKGCENIPVIVTLFKIGHHHVIDPTPLEEACSDVQLSVAINRKGLPCAIQKTGNGSIEPSQLAEMIQDAKAHGATLFKDMDEAIERQRVRSLNDTK